MKKIYDTHRRSLQQMIAFITVALLTAAIFGRLSAIWFLQDQLEQQAWSQVEQGQRAAIALHGAKYREILNLATLAAQRPTLHELLDAGDISALTDYLHTLKNGAGLTRIIVCNPDDQIIATTDEAVPETICQKWRTGNYQYNPDIPQACLTAHRPIMSDTGIHLGEVFVCNQLDDDFAIEISEMTGLEHTIWIDDIPVSTSFAEGTAALTQHQHFVVPQEERSSHHAFEIDGVTYYAAHLPLESAGLGAEVALDVSEILNKSEQFTKNLVIIIFGSVFIGSVMGRLIVTNRRDADV